MDLVHLKSQLRTAYGIDAEELNGALTSTSKIIQVYFITPNFSSVYKKDFNKYNAFFNQMTEQKATANRNNADRPALLPTPAERPQLLTGRPKKIVHYQPMIKHSDLLALAGDPESLESRRVLAEHWGLQLPMLVPLTDSEEDKPKEKKKPITGLVFAKIPESKKNLRDQRRARINNHGLLQATQRGVIPKTSKILMTPQPVSSLTLYPQSRESELKSMLPYDGVVQERTGMSSTFAQAPPNTRQAAGMVYDSVVPRVSFGKYFSVHISFLYVF